MKIGFLVYLVSEVEEVEWFGVVDYIGVGFIFFMILKVDVELVSGMVILEEICWVGIKLLIVGIGGINEINLVEVFIVGVDGVLVILVIIWLDDCYFVIK